MPPQISQLAKSMPLANPCRPEYRKPPSTRFARPAGSNDAEMMVLWSLPQTSSCACAGKVATSTVWSAKMCCSQACEPSAAASTSATSHSTSQPIS